MDFEVLEHPLYPLPSAEQCRLDPLGTRSYLKAREERIGLERDDPFRYGYRPGVWGLVDEAFHSGKSEVLVLGGNRSSKSHYGARRAMEVLMSGPNKMVWCLQTAYKNSVEMQQPLLYHYLPWEWKDLRSGKVQNVSYSQKLGFSGGKFILPNGSQCCFRNYSQMIQTVEGAELDFVWADEQIPLDWLETLRYRLVTRAGKLLITFTPVSGWNQTVNEYLEGAKTLSYAPAPLLPKGAGGRLGQNVPRTMQPARASAFVVFFHITDNPFGGYEALKTTLAGASREEVLCRAYGIPTRSAVTRFPRFRDSVHVLAPDKIPQKGSNYHIVDPASSRNWFMLWIRVVSDGTHYVYREWPAQEEYVPGAGVPGSWAEADGKMADGRLGAAQESFGWGIVRYLEEIGRLEAPGEDVVERWMDSRFGQTPTQKADGATSLIEECALAEMYFHPTAPDPIEEGVSLINSMLDYENSGDKETDHPPKLFISSDCQNLIFAMKIWTGKDGRFGATKDPIDCLRYAAMAQLAAFDLEELNLEEPAAY